MTVVTITVDVDVELDQFSDEDIQQEAEARGIVAETDGDKLTALYYAFYFNQTEKAMQLAREVASDHVGRFLP